jgi:hypothetical protein
VVLPDEDTVDLVLEFIGLCLVAGLNLREPDQRCRGCRGCRFLYLLLVRG